MLLTRKQETTIHRQAPNRQLPCVRSLRTFVLNWAATQVVEYPPIRLQCKNVLLKASSASTSQKHDRNEVLLAEIGSPVVPDEPTNDE